MEIKNFLDRLSDLENRFDKIKPELLLTVTDSDLDVEGYVVVWSTKNSIGGPLGRCGKGGTRISKSLTLEEVAMLAKTMSLKNAAAGLPLGGAKSGLKADPEDPFLEKKYRRFVSLVRPILRENGGIFGGFGFDVGTKPITAIWACDELQSYRSFTGKPLELGGTDYDREGIAGFGVVEAARQLMIHRKLNISGATCAIQGLGAMGAAVFRYLHESQASIEYISDPRIGGTYKVSSSSVEPIYKMLIEQNIQGIKDYFTSNSQDLLPLDSVLYADVDILFPCALQGVISQDNQSRIKARNIVEAANNPLNTEARSSLWRRGIYIIPDFIANPGGIIAAYVELTSNISHEENLLTKRNVIEAKSLTKEKIQENVQIVLDKSQLLNIDPTLVAKEIALSRIFD